jgi:putative transposase
MFDPTQRNRKSTRLKNYDYSTPGYYFVTICTQNRQCWLGEVQNSQMKLNSNGRIVEEAWRNLPSHFPTVQLDQYILMPNHLHGILVVGATFMAPKTKAKTPTQGVINHVPTFGEIIRRFKAVSSRAIHKKDGPAFSWQRNYYEHVIRRDEFLDEVRKYILANPLKWELDKDNPVNFKSND